MAFPLAAADDANVIIKRLIAAEKENGQRAEQYTYVEETERFTFDKRGEAHRTGSETHDVIFVEGMKYKKLVARNGKHLGARERAQVEKDMQLTAEERRKHQHRIAPGGMITIGGLFTHQSLDLGSLSELLTLYDNRVAGEESVRGHKTWMIDSTPRHGYLPRSEHERQVVMFAKKIWVDQEANLLMRAVYTVIVEDGVVRPGSTITQEFEKVDAETWEPISLTLNFAHGKVSKVFRATARTVYSMSNFLRFDVHSTITVTPEGPPT